MDTTENQHFDVLLEMGEAGWAYMHLELAGKSLRVRLSEVFNPFPNLVDWGRRAAEEDVEIGINEEGFVTMLTLRRTGNPDQVLLRVWDRVEETTLLQGNVSRSELVANFKAEIRLFFETEFNPNQWEPDNGEDPGPDWVPTKQRVLGNDWFS
jgi:hypothetical protein